MNKPETQPEPLPPAPFSAIGGTRTATLIVHTPSGPIAVCETHAIKLRMLMQVIGVYTYATPAPEGAECANCKNEAKSPNDQAEPLPPDRGSPNSQNP